MPEAKRPDETLQEAAFPVVGIGASAGGIEACSALLRAVPVETGAAFVIIQHLSPDTPSMLAQVLARETELPVVEAQDQQTVQPNCIYVIPPNVVMTIADGQLHLAARPTTPPLFLPIDAFFESLAADCTNQAVGVVLSGLDGDGAEGLRLIKRAGGITFAQTESTAQFSDMPNTAVETGEVDFILPPDAIAQKLAEIAQHPYLLNLESASTAPSSEPTAPAADGSSNQPSNQASDRASDESNDGSSNESSDEDHLLAIYKLLKAATGVDFNQYKRATFERRLRRRMALYRLDTLLEYVDYLQKTPDEIGALGRDVLITVTSFFRDAEAFTYLKESIFPSLIEQKGLDASIRVWVAGCATGEECYSLAIGLLEFLSEQNINPSIQFFGTDVSEEAIDVARQGIYTENRLVGVSAERRRRFFTRSEGRYQISKAVRELCVFARQNLGSDPPFSNIDLISCRNVLIYFAPVLQKRVRAIFHYSLNPNGFLWLGSSESIGETSELFEITDNKHKVYNRKTVANQMNFDFVSVGQAGLTLQRPEDSPQRDNPNYSNVQRQADQIVLNRYAPVGVVINEQFDILHFRGNTSPYLRPAPGEPSFNLFKMVQPSLLIELRGALEQARRQDTTVRKEGLQIEGSPNYIQAEITPIKNPLSRARNYLVLFEEGPLIAAQRDDSQLETSEDEPDKDPDGSTPSADPQLSLLQQELAATKQELLDTQAYLQATIEEHESTHQRLTTANEEILSSNEELQSTNEELQTAKEEIQAANEELKTTNEELQSRNADARSTNDDLLNLLNNVKVPVVMLSNELRIRRFTPSAQVLFNLIPADVGRPISNIRIDVDLPDFETLILEVIRTLDAQEREVQDGAGRWYQLRIRPYRTAENVIDGAVVTLIDINDIKQTLEQLEAARRYAERIVETVREPLVVLSQTLQVITANQAFYETFQLTVEETEGRSLFELSNRQWNIPELQTALTSILSPSISVNSVQIQDLEIERDFEQLGHKTLLLNAREIEQSINGPMILLAIEDITERRQAETERIQLAQAQAARQEAEAANISKDEFLSVLSHELRTPLSVISGWTNILMQSPALNPTLLNRAIASIDRSTQTQTRIIEDLLEVSRIIQGQLELRQVSVNLTELVSNVIEGLLPTAEQVDIQLAANLDDAPGHFYFDPDRLQQVVSNALSNAIKFTPAGGLINTQLTYSQSQATIKIVDTGQGIDPDFLPRVFDRFRQATSANTRQYGGLGLGLAIVKTFVEAHDGTVAISSPGLGQGTTLTITLPLVPAVAPLTLPSPLPTGENLLMSLRLLVVEDNLDNLEILKMMLEGQGATVITATSVAAAMEQLVAEDIIDLLISDISMPGEDGFDLIRKIRTSGNYDQLPAIAVTGYAAVSDSNDIFRAGYRRHLSKPIDIDTLVAAIVDLVA
ncbi:chemotaxis protein CheB [cf. Phormidesmis sp. LEGE 11477]|uniref:chemotaxis protein CheB n=1 Tax=cf. Phormidesmis sp. LEGE 11477 TaxID=1828680 RepID=UPI00187E4C3C|nr:chemotaxis protein CheB [cf. Phormidesmis sp. LEGE 11477]MBE9062796.1 PAS domain-containing protein [cf. Phormidesmis sp. LEGE 11477]